LSDANGAFLFLAVPPGRYELRVLRMTPEQSAYADPVTTLSTSPRAAGGTDEPTWWASMSLDVGESPLRDVEVVLQRGAHVTGRIDWSGLTTTRLTLEQLQRLTIRFESADGRAELSQAVVRPDAQGRFRSPQLAPGRYVVRVASAPGVWAAVFDGREVSMTPLEVGSRDVEGLVVALAEKGAEIIGQVRKTGGAPDDAAVVLVFPADRATWMDYGRAPRHLRRVRAGQDGAYSVTGLLPGRYHLAAIPDDGSTAWMDPANLERLAAGASTVHVATGQRTLLDLATRVGR
jgi:hypothetical protein